MSDMTRDFVQKQCQQFLESLGTSGFIVLGWKKEDDTYDIVQSTNGANLIAHTKGLVWALNEVTKNM